MKYCPDRGAVIWTMLWSLSLKNQDMAVYLVAFKVKLDAATQQPAATFLWQPPLLLPKWLADALAAARRP